VTRGIHPRTATPQGGGAACFGRPGV
jgi:hypothetical protein